MLTIKNKLILLQIVAISILILTGFTRILPTVTLYKVGDNTTTIKVSEAEVFEYTKNYEWSVEPTELMYAADGRTSWMCKSEVEQYKKVGWSLYPPVTIYSCFAEKNVLVEEVGSYLATGIWFNSPPINLTLNPFTKTNLPPDELEKVLQKGLSGYGQAFYDIEQEYGVNSIFAISVAQLESGHGTSSAFRNKNNAFGVGPGRYFESVDDGIDYFGQLMKERLYYGKSIDSIGSIYCVGGNWANKVKSLMNRNISILNKIGFNR